jgi:hypothetical protein
MLQQHVVFLVLQLRAVEPAVANPAVRSWQPQGPQLENGVFIVVRLHLSCCFSTKKNKEKNRMDTNGTDQYHDEYNAG